MSRHMEDERRSSAQGAGRTFPEGKLTPTRASQAIAVISVSTKLPQETDTKIGILRRVLGADRM